MLPFIIITLHILNNLINPCTKNPITLLNRIPQNNAEITSYKWNFNLFHKRISPLANFSLKNSIQMLKTKLLIKNPQLKSKKMTATLQKLASRMIFWKATKLHSIWRLRKMKLYLWYKIVARVTFQWFRNKTNSVQNRLFLRYSLQSSYAQHKLCVNLSLSLLSGVA